MGALNMYIIAKDAIDEEINLRVKDLIEDGFEKGNIDIKSIRKSVIIDLFGKDNKEENVFESIRSIANKAKEDLEKNF